MIRLRTYVSMLRSFLQRERVRKGVFCMPSDTANMIFNSNVILLILRTQAKVQPTLNFLFLIIHAVRYGYHDFQIEYVSFDYTYASAGGTYA